ncbi:hypothetical protein XELAEV_18038435mg [Xenopus laevis]|uniref:Uncharacterized protein n=1 Tax=Xenopus laevis TaxID=8355 RepID=A0A974C5Y0_XENLA|nr:hypothetical protein XELAEV_18038435mg [Xenopus laevis]
MLFTFSFQLETCALLLGKFRKLEVLHLPKQKTKKSTSLVIHTRFALGAAFLLFLQLQLLWLNDKISCYFLSFRTKP